MKLSWIVLLAVSVFGEAAYAADPKVLKDVKSFTTATEYVTELQFSEEISASEVGLDFINDTIQLSIPNGKVGKSKKVTPEGQAEIKSVYTYQATRDLLRCRIIYNKGFNIDQFRGLVNISQEGSKLIVKIPRPGLEGTQSAGPIAIDEVSAPAEVEDTDPVEALAASGAEIKSETAAGVTETPSAVEKAEKNLKESEIPVLTETKAPKAASTASPFKKMALSLAVVFAILGGLAFAGRRWLQQKHANRPNTQIRIITQHYLGPRKSLAIIHVAGESMLIGVTDHNINLIKPLSLIDDEIPTDVPKSFDQTLTQVDSNQDPKENFSIRGIRDVVANRLKNMREL